MSKTGATDSQIEAAVRQRYEDTSFMAKELPWNRMNPDLRKTSREMFVRDAAQWLVKPTERIVSVADLKNVIELYDLLVDNGVGMQGPTESIDRIRALIGGE